jgi:hypothetical protein
MAQALVAAAPAALEGLKWAYKNREGIKSGLDTGIKLARKYTTAAKPLVNQLLTVRGRKKSAAALINKIKNPVKSAKEFSQFISSGKAGRIAGDIAKDAHSAIGAVENITGKDLSRHKSLVSQGEGKFNHYHDMLNKFNTDVSKTLR